MQNILIEFFKHTCIGNNNVVERMGHNTYFFFGGFHIVN